MSRVIFDSHIHFWDPAQIRFEWLSSVPLFDRAYLPSDLLAQSAEYDLEGIIFVEADCLPADAIREAEWVTSLAAQEPRIQGIVAHAPLEIGAAVNEHLAALAAMPLVKSVRRLIQAEGLGFCVQPAFVEGVQQLAAHGLSFDLCIVHSQLEDTIRLVDQCPDVSFVLDHIGKPDIGSSQLDPWREQLRTLAGFPNVWCKLSGLVTEADHQRWTRDDLRPYIDHVIDVFGIDRVMYGGDWPVSLLATDYVRWIETVEWATAELGPEAQGKIFRNNVKSFYRCNS